MNEFVAYYSRWRVALIFLGSLGFVAIGLWLVGAFGEVPGTRRSSDGAIAAGWVSIFIFGLCGLAAVKKFFDDKVVLQIGPSGILWLEWSDDLNPWSGINDVTTWSHRGQKAIVLNLRNPSEFPGRGLPAMLASAGRSVVGGDITISLNATDRSYAEAMSAIAHFQGATR